MDSDIGSPHGTGPLTRRALLASGASGVAVATAGCAQQVRSVLNRRPDEQLSLSIVTVITDVDTESVRVTRRIRAWLEECGIDVAIEHLAGEEYRRQVLINHDFDLFVGPYPVGPDPDALFEALHSRFAEEAGWQNPFGFTSMAFDDLLIAQRDATGEARREATVAVLEAVADEQPFVPICTPTEHRLVRNDRVSGWYDRQPDGRTGILGLAVERENDARELRATITDARPTENLNPLSAEYVYREAFVDLLYDSLGTIAASPDADADGHPGTESTAADDAESGAGTDRRGSPPRVEPWLAESWTWEGESTNPIARVTIREAEWHDGESVTATDVAFTYRLLADTSMGSGDVRSPAPRYRGLAAAVDGVAVEGDRTLTIQTNADTAIAERAFTVPILPKHIWVERTDPASIPGVDVAAGTTDAVIVDNVPPIGSGPFAFESVDEREYLRLERVADHFAWDQVDQPGTPADAIEFRVGPSSASAIEAVEAGAADLTLSPLNSPSVSTASDVTSDEIELRRTTSESVYCLGFNARTAPMSNPYFRRAVASVVDKAFLVEDVFNGHARPIAAPAPGAHVPSSLAWDDQDPVVPFLGNGGDLDAARARRAFEDAGYRYDGDGHLLVRS